MSRVLVAPGVRTGQGRGWRAGVATAFAVVTGDLYLWLLGALSFAARGGLLVLAFPILTIPSPVLLSIFFRDEITTSGPGPEFAMLTALLAVGCGVVVLLALLVAALADMLAFERTVADPETEALRLGRTAVLASRAERTSTWLWVAAIGAAGLVPILLAALVAARRVGVVLVDELQLPSAVDVPLYQRVVMGAAPELLATLVIALVAEVATSLATRRLMAWRLGISPFAPAGGEMRVAFAGALRMVRQPVRTLFNAVLAWGVTLGTLAPALFALALAWGSVRDVLIGSRADPDWLLAAAVAISIFAAVWIGGVILAGFGSAIRAAIWTVDTLR
jgi:hypothetical protein